MHVMRTSIVISLLAAAGPAMAVGRPAPFPKSLAVRLADSPDRHERLVIKFREGSGVRLRDGHLVVGATRAAGSDLAELERVRTLLREHGLRPQRLFTVPERWLEARQQELAARTARPLADLNLYVQLRLPPSEGRRHLPLVRALNALSVVEVAYLEAPTWFLTEALNTPIDDLAPPGITPLLVQHQQYLAAAPTGVGAFGAWAVPGGTGSGVRVMVYDNAYRTTHEDVPPAFYASTMNPVGEEHGTAVIGIVAARHNGAGIKGAAYGASIGFQRAAAFGESHADRLLAVAGELEEGDVLLTEVGRKVNALGFECASNPTQANSVPIEFYPAEFDAVSSLVAAGVTVVETAGNGCVDFDSAVFEDLFGPLLPGSGALWVTAGLSDARTPTSYANHGSRVDLHAWGEDVVTLSYLRPGEVPVFDKGPDRLYVPNFGGSSAAAAIVAGVVASVQGQALAAYGEPLSPQEVRDLLVATGTPQEGDLDRPIGPMPDLAGVGF